MPETTDHVDMPIVRLIQDARTGDEHAFAQLYGRHRPWAMRYALRLATGRTIAEDLVAEAFVRTFEQLRRGRGPDRDFVAYLRAAVLNAHLQRLRVEGRYLWAGDLERSAIADPALMARLTESDAETVVLERLLHQRVRQALAGLPRHYRTVLVMVYVEGRPYREVSEQVALSVPATRQVAMRARAALRAALTTTPAPTGPWSG